MKRKICRIIINIFSLEKENTNLIKSARVYLLVGRKRAYLGKSNKLGEARIALIMGQSLRLLIKAEGFADTILYLSSIPPIRREITVKLERESPRFRSQILKYYI